MNTEKNTLGVALTKCFFCNKDNEIMMNTLLTPGRARAVEKMHGKVINDHPCRECEEYMQMGVILITIDSEKSGKDWNTNPHQRPTEQLGEHWAKEHKQTWWSQNGAYVSWLPDPYRAGGFFVVKDRFITDVFPKELAENALRKRVCFIEHSEADKMGLFKVKGTLNKDGDQ